MSALLHLSRSALRALSAIALGAKTRREIVHKWGEHGICDSSLDVALRALCDLSLARETRGRAASRGVVGIPSTYQCMQSVPPEIAELALVSRDSLAQLRHKIGAAQKNWGAPEFTAPPQNISASPVLSNAQSESKSVLKTKIKQKQTAVVENIEIVQKLVEHGISVDVARQLARDSAECELQINKLQTRAEKPANPAAYLRRAIEQKYVHFDVTKNSNISRYEPINIPPPPPLASESTRNACLQLLSQLKNEFMDTRH